MIRLPGEAQISNVQPGRKPGTVFVEVEVPMPDIDITADDWRARVHAHLEVKGMFGNGFLSVYGYSITGAKYAELDIVSGEAVRQFNGWVISMSTPSGESMNAIVTDSSLAEFKRFLDTTPPEPEIADRWDQKLRHLEVLGSGVK